MTATSDVQFYAKGVDPAVEELCFSAWSCQLSALVTDLWLLIAVGLAVGLVLASLVYLGSARTQLDEERSRTAAEREAFSEFARRVADLPVPGPASARPTANGGVTAIATSQSSASTLEAVRDAYRATVMAVSHYDEEYDEPLTTHMATEFGADVAQTVANGSEASPLLQDLLVKKATRAANQRDALMQALGREAASLEAAEDTFEELQSSLEAYHPHKLREEQYSTLGDRWDALDRLEASCAETVEARQQRLRTEPMSGNGEEAPLLAEYLYRSLEVDYPVLATGARFLEQIHTSRETLTRIAWSRS